MAANNLFPPIIDDYLPAFLQADNSCKIVFKLSQFNTADEFDLSLTQITVSNLNTNKSMLDLKTNKFEINTYYKIQVRLTGINAEAYDKTKEATWINNNLNNFSEWSTVCLIRAIATPTLQLHKVSDAGVLSAANIVGKLTFSNSAEKESIYAYKVLVKKNSNIEIQKFTGVINFKYAKTVK